MLFMLVPPLLDWQAYRRHQWLFTVTALLFGLGLERLLRVSLAQQPCRWCAVARVRFMARFPRLTRAIPAVLVAAASLFAIGYFSYYTILNHLRLQTSSWDLAIFDNMMWNLLRGHWFKASPDLGRTGSHIQFHATFIAYLLAPLYALSQRAETLLVIQATIVGAAAIPIYLLVKHHTQRAWVAVVFAVAYVIHAPLHGPLFYDFHFLTLAPFFISWVLYFFETGRKGWLIAAWLAALALREDQSACMATAALFFLLRGKRVWWALWGGGISAVYFVVTKFVIMPLHRGGIGKETFVWIFKGLLPEGENGFGAVLKTVVTNPVYTMDWLLDVEKLTYIISMFGPLLLLPLRTARTWILFVPAAMFTLLSTGYKPLYQIQFQYTANFTSYLFYAAAVVLAGMAHQHQGRIRVAAATVAVAATALLFSYNEGAILDHDHFQGGFRRVSFAFTDADAEKLANLRELIAKIPAGASVTATETEAPHVSNREDCFTMRFGYDKGDYLLVSLSEIRRGKSHTYFKEAMDTGEYGFVAQAGGFQLWQRFGPKEGNAEALKKAGIRVRK
jgi:uncharacterized membrane protein